MKAAISFLFSVLIATLVSGQVCEKHTTVDAILPNNVALTMFLVGDAGLEGQDCRNRPVCNDPVLRQLRTDVNARASQIGADNVVVVFLGDNVYLNGLSPDPKDQARLDAQVDVVRQTAVRAFFVPGNHDWKQNKVGGQQRIRAQAARLATIAQAPGGPRVSLRPGDACPGPEVETFGSAASLVFVDTAWFLQPSQDRPACGGHDEALKRLRTVLHGLSTPIVIISHHAFEKSAGKHGTSNGSRQDFGNPENADMRSALKKAVHDSGTTPLLWASGHDHSLGLLSGGTAKYHVTSGSGFARKPTPVKCSVTDLVFGAEKNGWMVVDFPKDASAPRLEVREVPGGPVFSRRLD